MRCKQCCLSVDCRVEEGAPNGVSSTTVESSETEGDARYGWHYYVRRNKGERTNDLIYCPALTLMYMNS